LRVNEFECQTLKVFVKQALIFQKLAGGGPPPHHFAFLQKSKMVSLGSLVGSFWYII
jgi:hypothetical protein